MIPGVTCPLGTPSFQLAGGADGVADGHLRTEVATVAGLLSNVTIAWQSPSFVAPADTDPSVDGLDRLRASLAALIDYVDTHRAAYLSLVRGAMSGDPAMQALFGRAAAAIDAYVEAHPRGDATLAEAVDVFAEVQAAKAFLADAAVRVVDRALALTGGAGYLAGHPLAKAYRDARAAGFMHPFGANRALDFVARAAVGLEPLAG